MSSEAIAVIAIIVTVFLAMLAHLITSVWWASNITARLTILQNDFAEMNANVNIMREIYVKKEDYNVRVAESDKQREAIWKKIDELKDKCKERIVS